MNDATLGAVTRLLQPASDDPSLDASVLLASLVGCSRSWIAAHPDLTLSADQSAALQSAVRRLQAGEPLPYVLGSWEFYGLRFIVSPDVLIPRPETELLVELALDWLHDSGDRRNVADIGTGSGCIGITLALGISDVDVLATDISEGALRVARQNAELHGVNERIHFMLTDLLPPLPPKSDKHPADAPVSFDLVCANLPYIPTGRLRGLRVYRHEPILALDGGPDGLRLIRLLFSSVGSFLRPAARLLIEIDETTAVDAARVAEQAFPSAHVRTHQDLAGRDRLLDVRLER